MRRNTRKLAQTAAIVTRLRKRITALEEQLKTALETATTDQLTGALNRHGFYDRFRLLSAHARRQSKELKGCVLIVDIDHFKNINDAYGHATGDQVLSALADSIRVSLRIEDIFMRYGGEEFVMWMLDADISQAIKLAERLRTAVDKKSISSGSEDIHLTISVGISCMVTTAFADAVQEFKDALVIADRRLYTAKTSGRNQVRAED